MVRARGRGKQRKLHPRGRSVEPAALEAVREVLGVEPLRRDLLIEYLHRIQAHYHHLSRLHLTALAAEMRLPMAEIYEVASFYAHFHIDSENPSLPVLRVCTSLPCMLASADTLLGQLRGQLSGRARVLPGSCMGRCDCAPVVAIDARYIVNASPQSVRTALDDRVEEPLPSATRYVAYVADGGYQLLQSCRIGKRPLTDILNKLEASGLRGLGGAGFPTAHKWRTVASAPGPRYMVVNADEGEPGTFKDRDYLAREPHRVLEGVLLAAWAVGAEKIYIYLRDEYPELYRLLAEELPAVIEAGLAPAGGVEVRRGAGAYICGEESAMLESIEGKRGLPRHRPPYVAEQGLFGRPTLVQNVETLYWLREILEQGAERFAALGLNGASGLRAYSVSGRVREPGVKRAPAGISARQLIDEYAGGMAEGHTFRAFLPGGASGGILPERLADLPLDFGSLDEHGCFVGSGALIVLSDQDDLSAVTRNLMAFFAHESCGQCTPCRVGTEKAAELLRAPVENEALLSELAEAMTNASICGLGQAAPNPVRSLYRFFRDDLM